MGIAVPTVDFLIDAAQRGVYFGSTLMIGRQHLGIGPWKLARRLAQAGMLPQGRTQLYQDLAERLWFAEPLFSSLGARELASLDISGHEGSTILWDLNDPVPDELHERFDVVFDSGSLEHIFRAPTALKNYMQMTRVGGHLIIAVPANNYFGHGLYQFSPDFFFASLNHRNGFLVERMLALPLDTDAPARLLGTTIILARHGRGYEVADPAQVGGRVQLVNNRPVMLMILARRVVKREVFATTPQQSDYAARWSEFDALGSKEPVATRRSAAALARRMLSPRVKLHLMLDVLPRLAPIIDPLHVRRGARRRSFRNISYFRPEHKP